MMCKFFFLTCRAVVAEIVHRLYYTSAASREVHAQQAQQLQIQDLAHSRVHAVRVPDHDAHRLQHVTADDEGTLCVSRVLIVPMLPNITLTRVCTLCERCQVTAEQSVEVRRV